MSSKTYIVVDQSGLIVNRIVLDDGAEWSPPEGYSIVWDIEGMNPGGTYINSVYTPEQPTAHVLPTLTKRQISAALIAAGVSLDPDAWMRGLLANIASPVPRALALNDWNNAPFYERENPLFNDPDLLAASGLTTQQVDQLWTLAASLPA